MRVGVLLKKAVRAFSAAVVGIINFRGNDPIPAKLFKVNDQGISTAADLFGVLRAIHADSSPCALVRVVFETYFYVWHLEEEQQEVN